MTGIETSLPANFLDLTWPDFRTRYDALESEPLDEDTADRFMRSWSEAQAMMSEFRCRLQLATMVDTTDTVASARYDRYLAGILPEFERAEHSIAEKVLGAGVKAEGFEVPIERMRAQANIFRDENLALLGEELSLRQQFEAVAGERLVPWQGRDIPTPLMQPFLQDPDRAIREEAWRAIADARSQDHERINAVWRRLLEKRSTIAANAGQADYQHYRWAELARLDYGPETAAGLDTAIESVASPAVARFQERTAGRLGLDRFRPWDMHADSTGGKVLKPFSSASELVAGMRGVFDAVDPRFGRYFDQMAAAGTLDLDPRPNKSRVGMCITMAVTKVPFIFGNAGGTHGDVSLLLHEGGHAFQNFEVGPLPYMFCGRNIPPEFAEVASTAMEFMGGSMLNGESGGFYGDVETARARIQGLRFNFVGWPNIAIGDSFQQWAYANVDMAMDPHACDEKWMDLHRRFFPRLDLTGIEDLFAGGWRDIFHFFAVPFYFIDYAMAAFAAVEVWRQWERDRAAGVARYREALALGGAKSLPESYAAIGATFDFAPGAIAPLVDKVEQTIIDLEQIAVAGAST